MAPERGRLGGMRLKKRLCGSITNKMDLTIFDKIRTTLAKSIDLAEIKETRDKVAALRIYAKTARQAREMDWQARMMSDRTGKIISRCKLELVKQALQN